MLLFLATHDRIILFTAFLALAAFLRGKPRKVRVKVSIFLFVFSAACFASLMIADRLGY
jgi:hypothetical protein